MVLVSGACQMGLTSVLVRYLPRAGARTPRIVLTSYALTAGLSALGALAVAATSSHWSSHLAFLAEGHWLLAFVLGTTAWTIFCLQDSVLTAIRAAHWVWVENVLFAIAKILLLIVVVNTYPTSGIFFAWTVPTVAAAVAVNLLLFAALLPAHTQRSVAEALDVRRTVHFATGNYIGSLLMLASTTLLPILITARLGGRQTAFFFIPWSIAVALGLVAVNMTMSLTVEVAFDESRLRDFGRRAIVHTTRIVVPVVVVLVAISPQILEVFGHSYARSGTTLLRLLAIASVPRIVVELGLSVARIQKRGRGVIGIQGGQCVLVLGLSLLLLPRFGINGVGIAWLVTQVVLTVALVLGVLRPLFSRSPDGAP
jgi:O-antigen/teichoic acid export membrane protein